MQQELKIWIFTLILSLITIPAAYSQTIENTFQGRTELGLSFDASKKIEFIFVPELRWDKSLGIDKFLLESRISYKPLKGLSIDGAYRFIVNPRTVKETEYLHRFDFGLGYERKIDRWEPSLRLKYTDYTEDASTGDYLRLRAKLKYDIPNIKLTPAIGVEPFYNIDEGLIYKYRYSAGLKYKLNKQNSIGIAYLLDYYMQDYQNNHILKLNYKISF